MVDAAPELRWRATERLQCRDDSQGQPVAIGRAVVREAVLGLAPYALVRVELWRVGRQVFEAKSRDASTQPLHELGAMNTQSIPYHDDRSTQVTQQMAEERDGFHVANVVVVPLVVEAHPATGRADGDPGDHRDAIVTLRMPQDRGLTPRRPRPSDRRREHEARFVYEDEVGPQPKSPLFTRG